MKLLAAILFTLVVATVQQALAQVTARQLIGAWEHIDHENRIVMICSEKYFSAAVYHKADGKFIGTCGGSYSVKDNRFFETHEFNTIDASLVGKEKSSAIEIKKEILLFTEENDNREWKRLDDGTPGQLAGAWLITGRMTNGSTISKMTPGARRTMKILSGTRFQWIAYNVETKEVSGTGGGTYSTNNGKYTETIEFFSKDNNRVGQSLQFDFSLQSGDWRHKGLSSKGEPIDEVWTKREKLGL